MWVEVIDKCKYLLILIYIGLFGWVLDEIGYIRISRIGRSVVFVMKFENGYFF